MHARHRGKVLLLLLSLAGPRGVLLETEKP